MKKLFFGLAFCSIFFVGCTPSEDEAFECTVDFIHFVTNENARVQFSTLNAGERKTYILELPYLQTKDRLSLGDEVVFIDRFTTRGNTASFEFHHGPNLGLYCASLFDVLPAHVHTDFEAEAERSLSEKTVGKWIIKKKRLLQ